MVEKTWLVYLLECRDGSFYTGVTNDLEKRLRTHAFGKGSKYVARKGFKRLVAHQECIDKSAALKAEYAIKQLPKWEKVLWFKP